MTASPHTATATTTQAPPRPTVVALVTAMRDELLPVVKQLGLSSDAPWFVGEHAHRQIVAGFTGVGRQRADEVFTTLIEEHRPTHVLHIGFAGGLDPALLAGSVIDAHYVRDVTGTTYDLTPGVPVVVHLDSAHDPARTMLTSDHLIHSVIEKTSLHRRYRCASVDMESFHVAKVAAGRGLHLRIIRAVSDPANLAVPAEALRWVNPDGTDNVPAALWHLATHPWKVPITLRLARNVGAAGRNLAKAVEQAIRSIP